VPSLSPLYIEKGESDVDFAFACGTPRRMAPSFIPLILSLVVVDEMEALREVEIVYIVARGTCGSFDRERREKEPTNI
jgi:hypothetical protein